MLAGIREILIITTPHDQSDFQELLGDGSQFGVHFEYAIQPKPAGLAQAFVIAEDFLESEKSLMILGDNIFYGAGLGRDLETKLPNFSAHIFTYQVANPSQYGVLQIDEQLRPIRVVEKPRNFISNQAVTGLYFFDSNVAKYAKLVTPSERGELEITSLLNIYLQQNLLTYTRLSRGTAWLDTGTVNSLNDAGNFVRIVEERTGNKIGCLEEIGYSNDWISRKQIQHILENVNSNSYKSYLEEIFSE
jgi:glucose-1-phosphate thymidylyltransferase